MGKTQNAAYFVRSAETKTATSRAAPTEILSRELATENRQRADLAEKMLIDLGGWSAVQRLSQRRSTLNRLDKVLSQSEMVVHNIFERTIRQASFNFYFGMGSICSS